MNRWVKVEIGERRVLSHLYLDVCPFFRMGKNESRSGAAIIIVLVFIVLIAGIVTALLAASMSNLKISQSNAEQLKVDLFAKGALDIVVGDLKQEIVDGSTTLKAADGVTEVKDENNKPVYVPKTSACAVPERVGTANTLPNLVKRSVRNLNFYTIAGAVPVNGPSRAAAVSAEDSSINGRLLKVDRWNRACLLPKVNPGSDTILDPVSEFISPDWVLVARDGTNPTGGFNGTFKLNGSNPVLGRFAYTIYDEGGLIDTNVAGYPSTSTSAQKNSKVGLAYADLSLIFVQAGFTQGEATQIVDRFLQWRNYSTLQPALAFPQQPVAFGSAAGDSYYSYVLSSLRGFIAVGSTALFNGQSDRQFASRQELQKFLLQGIAANSIDRAKMQVALQYLATFTRALEQPSFFPPTGRPSVATLSNGGNDSSGLDNSVNPALLSIRVPTLVAGGRIDGSDLKVGEPLVKKRFPLSRLTWLTYKGPSAGRTGVDITSLKTNYNITQDYLNKGTAAAIQKSFGLQWNNGGFWTYNVHTNGLIKNMSQVASENREPDFVELLKASITAGALGKSGTQGSSPNPAYIEFIRDSTLDFHVIQIAANLIDQSDVDGYPTRIQYAGREFRGVENLPYLYRIRNGLYRIINPNPMPSGASDWTSSTTALTDPGTFIMVQQPEIWNPHGYDASSASATDRSLGNPRPQNLQLLVFGGSPALPPSVPVSNSSIGVRPRWRGGDGGSNFASSPLRENTTKMTFTNGNTLYREPTLLIKPGLPAGSNLKAPGLVQAATSDGLSAYVSGDGIKVLDSVAIAYGGVEPNSGIYCGIYLGKNVIAYSGDNGSAPYPAGTRVAGQAHYIGPSSLTYQLQCESSTGSGMDTYDEKYFAVDPFTDGLSFGASMLSTSTTDTNTYSGRFLIGVNRLMTCFDPRTNRFGVMSSSTGDDVFFQSREFSAPGARSPGSPKWVDRANNVVSSNRLDTNSGFGFATPNDAPPSNSQGWKWDNQLLRFGLFSQNSTTTLNDDLRFNGDLMVNTGNQGSAAPQYYGDSDGVVRRAMGGHVLSSGSISAASVTGLPMATAYYSATDVRQKESRPIILNRPFHSVGEVAYTFSDVPWKNLDFSTPESGYAALGDIFCISDLDSSTTVVAGKVDLNTRQIPVLNSILSGSYQDEYNGVVAPLSIAEGQSLASALVTRTTSAAVGKGPLVNVSDLVGGWKSGTGTNAVYDGFSADITATDVYANNISRYKESAIRSLGAAGNTRVWNLMVDLVAQTGQYPSNATVLKDFKVDGEQRYWVHLAIDRYSGNVIDRQIEVIKE